MKSGLSKAVALLVATLLVVALVPTQGVFTLNGFNVGSEGNIVAKLVMLNNRLIEFNFGLLNPPVATRAITLLDVCMYDAISYFHPTFLPLIAKNLAPKTTVKDLVGGQEALAIAAYRCIRENWGAPRYNTSEFANLDAIMANFSINVNNNAQDNSPAGIGNRAARMVIDFFLTNNSNALGTDRSSPGDFFSDTTNYWPVNDAAATPGRVDCSRVRSINHWVPLRYPSAANGAWRLDQTQTIADNVPADGSTVPHFAGVQASKWKPIVMKSADQFLPPSPPQLGTNTDAEFRRNVQEILDIFANFNDTTKATAEYWAERVEVSMGGPMGRMQEWACILSFQRNLDLFESIKLVVTQGVAMYDAAVAVWETKRYYDWPRPISAIVCLRGNETINTWRGPYQGVGPVPGNVWFPYWTPGSITPPFPAYVSGHATFSSATAEVFRLWNNGNDTLDWQFIFREGTSLLEPRRVQGEPGFVAGVTDVPNQGPATRGYSPARDVVLYWPTFSAAARDCGYARLLSGVHLRPDYEEGNVLGKKIAQATFDALGCAFRGQACCAPKLV